MVMKIKVSKTARYIAVVVFIIQVLKMNCFPDLFRLFPYRFLGLKNSVLKILEYYSKKLCWYIVSTSDVR